MEPHCFVPEDSNDFRIEEEVKTIEVKLNEIPEFLRSGGYYCSFWDDVMREYEQLDAEAQAIMVPQICFRATTSVSDANDLHHLLSTLRFWLVDVLPDSVIAYALDDDTAHSFSAVAGPFINDLPKLKVLQTTHRTNDRSRRLITAMNETSCEEIVEYLFKHKKDESPVNAEVASTTAKVGSVQYLQYAHEQGCSWDASTSIKAAEGGHLDCMKYAHEHGCPFDYPDIDIITGTCTGGAAYHGHLNCLQYAHQHGASLYPDGPCDALGASALGGHIDCMQYALNNGCSCDERIMILAVGSGKVECVKCLIELGCEWDEDAFEAAMEVGQLDMVVFLQNQGCPWNEDVCTIAAEAGHLDCLQYLHEQGCPWDEDTTLAAAATGRVSCLEYAITQGCPVEQDICSEMFLFQTYESCATGSRIHCLKYLHHLGYTISGAATTAAKNAGDTDCVEYIASIQKGGPLHG